MAIDRPAVHAYLSVEAHAAWQMFAEENGCSLTGLLESIGQDLAKEMAEAGDSDIRQLWVKAARKIDAARRRRGGDR